MCLFACLSSAIAFRRISDRRMDSSLSLYLSPSADIISAVEFDHTGEFLATGDKGGRIVLFQRESSV